MSPVSDIELRGTRLLVALGDLPLVIGRRGAYLRLALLLWRVLRGFLAAIGLTVHVPARLSSRKAGRDEQCPHLYRYGHRLGVSQGDDVYVSLPPSRRIPKLATLAQNDSLSAFDSSLFTV